MSKNSSDDSSNKKKELPNLGIVTGAEIQQVLSGINSINQHFYAIQNSGLFVSKFAEGLLAAISFPFNQYLEEALVPYKRLTFEFDHFTNIFRNIQDMSIRISDVFENLADSIFKPLQIISDMFKRNAEVIDNFFNSISQLQSFQKIITFQVPFVTFDREFEQGAQLPPKQEVVEEAEKPSVVKHWLEENKFVPFKPRIGFAEYRVTIEGEKDGQVKVFTQRQEIKDLKRVEAILPYLTEEKPLLPEVIRQELNNTSAVVSSSEDLTHLHQAREIRIDQEHDRFIIFIEGLGSSDPIESCNWIQMLSFFHKHQSLPTNTIIWKWNALEKNRFKSRKKVRQGTDYISQIIRQIYDGVKRYFPLAAPHIKIKRYKSDNFVTYRLEILPNLTS